jgi:GH25 family lysozyme M1 (1,4-beta-N-acetylmuramidase)
MPSYTPGIDVSHWQAQIDWPAVHAAGQIFAFIKASEGSSYADPAFATNWPAAKAAGLIRGAYHFFRPLQDAKKQADLFLRTVQQEPGDMPPTLDLEVSDNLKPATYISRVEIWIKAVEEHTGLKTILYSSPYFLNTFFQIPAGGPPLWARDHPLWIANYRGSGATQPTMPTGWNSWTFWQYSASGSVNGIHGNVDTDWYQGTAEQLSLWVGNPVPNPVTYTVKPGDTLESIVANFNVSLAQLVQANPQLAQPGMVLTIPGTGGGTGPNLYIVQPGDTLTSIAARFNTTVARLVQLNNITDPNLIYVGQQLIIG